MEQNIFLFFSKNKNKIENLNCTEALHFNICANDVIVISICVLVRQYKVNGGARGDCVCVCDGGKGRSVYVEVVCKG